MSEKSNQSRTTIACPTPLVLFGIDSRGKPKAARFGKQHAGLALKAATQLQLQVLMSNDPKIADLDRSAAGRPGPCHWPDLRAVHSPRPLRSACCSRCERERPSSKLRRLGRQGRRGQRLAARRPTCRKIGKPSASAIWLSQTIAGRRAGTRQSSSRPTATCSRYAGATTRGNAGSCGIGFGLGCSIPNAKPTADTGKSAKASGQAKHDKPVSGKSGRNGQSLPKDWDEIDIGHLVLAKDDRPMAGVVGSRPGREGRRRVQAALAREFRQRPADHAATARFGADLPRRCVTAKPG